MKIKPCVVLIAYILFNFTGSCLYAQPVAKMILPIGHFYGTDLLTVNKSETYLASSDENNKIVIWDLLQNREIKSFSTNESIHSICFAGDHQLIVNTSIHIIKINLIDNTRDSIRFHQNVIQVKFLDSSFYVLLEDDVLYCYDNLFSEYHLLDSNILFFDVDFDLNKIIKLHKNSLIGNEINEEFATAIHCIKNDSLFALGYKNGAMYLWYKYLDSFEKINQFNNRVNRIIKGFNNDEIIACSDDFTVLFYDLKKIKNKENIILSDYCSDIVLLKNRMFISCYNGVIYSYNSNHLKDVDFKTSIHKATSFESLDKNALVLGYDDGSVEFVDKKNNLIINNKLNVGESVHFITLDTLNKLIYISTNKKGLFVFSLVNFTLIKNLQFGSDLYSVHLDFYNNKIIAILSDSLVLLDNHLKRLKSLKAIDPWFVNNSNQFFYVGGHNGYYYINTITNEVEFERSNIAGSDDFFFQECIPYKDALMLIEREGSIWKKSLKNTYLICDLNEIVHHSFLDKSSEKLYFVTEDNKVYELDLLMESVKLLFYDSTIQSGNSWSIDSDINGNFLLSSSNNIYLYTHNWDRLIRKYEYSHLICRASDSRRSALFLNGTGDFASISMDGSVHWSNYKIPKNANIDWVFEVRKKNLENQLNVKLNRLEYRDFQYTMFFSNNRSLKYLQLGNNDWLAYDEHCRFTGSTGGIEQLYLVCGLEIIELNQVKDSLYVPDLISQIMNGAEEIMMNDKPVAKLEDLLICELTPLVEPQKSDNSKKLRYKIIPRNGGLGKTELYINGNLTYTYTKSNLNPQKKKDGNTVYILEIDTDSLQPYAIGEKGHKNAIQIKPMIEGGAIYGRGVGSYIEKSNDEKSPKFIGVFIGVNDYNNPDKKSNSNHYTNLDYAEKDAVDLSKAVAQSAYSLFQDSVLIYNVTSQNNRSATKKELELVFADIAIKSKSSDVLYIFFAGHGDIPKGATNQESEVRFMLHQSTKTNPMSTSFGMSELRTWLNPQKIKAQKRVFVFDACHSGQVIEDFNKYAFRGNKDDAWREKQLDKLKDQSGLLIMAAAADNESSYEDPQLQHGVLSYHLLKELKESSQDTQIIIRDWFDQSKQEVESYVLRKYGSRGNGNAAPIQSPKIFGSGDFALGLSTEQVRATIDLASVKTLLGAIQFTDATGSIMSAEPNMMGLIEAEIRKRIDANKIEFNPKADYGQIGYTIQSGTMVWVGDISINTYTIRYKGQDVKQIVIPQFAAKKPIAIAIGIAESIGANMKAVANSK